MISDNEKDLSKLFTIEQSKPTIISGLYNIALSSTLESTPTKTVYQSMDFNDALTKANQSDIDREMDEFTSSTLSNTFLEDPHPVNNAGFTSDYKKTEALLEEVL